MYVYVHINVCMYVCMYVIKKWTWFIWWIKQHVLNVEAFIYNLHTTWYAHAYLFVYLLEYFNNILYFYLN